MEEETCLMVDKIRHLQNSASVVNLTDVLSWLTNDVVCRAALGRNYGEDGEGRKFQKLHAEFVELMGSFSVGDYVLWLSWINRINGLDERVEIAAKSLDEFLERVIQHHRDRAEVGDDNRTALDFVDILLQFQKESKDSTSPVEDYTIKVLIQDMFGAGTDTTSNALEWTIAELIKKPRSMRILQNEVRQVIGGKAEIDEDDVEKMFYSKVVIRSKIAFTSSPTDPS